MVTVCSCSLNGGGWLSMWPLKNTEQPFKKKVTKLGNKTKKNKNQ